MMRNLIVLGLVFLLFSYHKAGAQGFTLECDMTPDMEEVTDAPPTHYEGKYITSEGVLKVLVVFIRFPDDNQTSPTWPDPEVLPDWAANIVSDEYSEDGSEYPDSLLSSYFYQTSFGSFHIIGDVYYTTTDSAQTYYLQYSVDHGQDSARMALQIDIFDKLDPIVDFNDYDNWRYNSIYNIEEGPDSVLDMCYLITRDIDRTSAGNFPYGGARLFHPTNFRKDGVLIRTGILKSGITMFGRTITNPVSHVRPPNTSRAVVNTTAHETLHFLTGAGHFAYPNDNSAPVLASRRSMSSLKTYAGGWNGLLSGYERWRLGWMQPQTISFSGTYDIWDLVSTMPDPSKHTLYKIDMPYSDQFILIENRQWISDFEPRYASDSGIHSLLKPGVLIYQIIDEKDHVPGCRTRKFDADGRFVWEMINYGGLPIQSDDEIDKGYPDRVDGYSETERIYIDGYGSNWYAWWLIEPPYAGPYLCTNSNGGSSNATDLTGDSLDLYDVGYVLSPWSNTPSHYWKSNSDLFLPTTIGIEVTSFDDEYGTYTLTVALTNPEILAPSKPYLGNDPRDIGPRLEGWVYLAWDTDLWDGHGIEPDVNWSQLQRKAPPLYNWTTVYSGSSMVWQDNSLDYDPEAEDPIYFRVRVRDSQNKWSVWSNIYNTATDEFQGGSKIIAQSDPGGIPDDFTLSGNYPNPFNPSTLIRFDIPEGNRVLLRIYNTRGQLVKTLVNEYREAGTYQATWNGRSENGEAVSSGVYFYAIQAGDFKQIRKMVLLK